MSSTLPPAAVSPPARGRLAEIALEMRRLALIAGGETLTYFQRDDLAVDAKADDSPVTSADHAADAVIVTGLEKAAPDIPVITEERAETHAKLNGGTPGRFFLIDPLDGTKEFISGAGEYTVNIALIQDGAPVLGVVYAPAKKRLFWTPEPGFAVEENGDMAPAEVGATRLLQVVEADPEALRVVASKSHRDDKTNAYIARRKVADVVSAGSSLKFCLIAAGEADLYPRFGRTMEWDTAAAQGVLRAAGGWVIRAQGGVPLAYGKPGCENPHFIAIGGIDPASALDGPVV